MYYYVYIKHYICNWKRKHRSKNKPAPQYQLIFYTIRAKWFLKSHLFHNFVKLEKFTKEIDREQIRQSIKGISTSYWPNVLCKKNRVQSGNLRFSIFTFSRSNTWQKCCFFRTYHTLLCRRLNVCTLYPGICFRTMYMHKIIYTIRLIRKQSITLA